MKREQIWRSAVPSSVTIDASYTLKMLLPNSIQPKLYDQMGIWQENNVPLYAPTLWQYEVTSTLAKLVRFREITKEVSEDVLEMALALDISIVTPDKSICRNALDWTYRLKRASAYDSFYLALAELLQGELWTADRKLVRAAGQDWIHYAGT